jgi:ubiquinone/menaquinone biosynthesis C-methylase UbiE
MDFNRLIQQQNVYYLTPEVANFSMHYLAVREKENRIFTDAEVRKLPNIEKHEWPFRVKSTERFVNYIASKNSDLQILTIGCGNGWFTNKIAKVSEKNQVIGLDMNREELEQAARTFPKKNTHFVYGDIFKISKQFEAKFDIITLNGAIQYFEGFEGLMILLNTFLRAKGEIHIIDSPFYNTSEIPAAKERTKAYYNELAVPEMAEQYHAHNLNLVKKFDTLYRPKKNIIHKILGKKDSPFSWYRLIKK